jgi:hypothetical protein
VLLGSNTLPLHLHLPLPLPLSLPLPQINKRDKSSSFPLFKTLFLLLSISLKKYEFTIEKHRAPVRLNQKIRAGEL